MWLTQEQKIYRHLRAGISLSGLEAADLYRVRDLPKRISVLRGQGLKIRGQFKNDILGGRIMHYRLAE